MIRLFGQTDKYFLSNGDVVLRPIKASVHNEDGGDFNLSLETGLEYSDYLTEDRIIVAPTPKGDQPFRISNVTKTKSKISLTAWHTFYDSERYLIADSYVVEKNCNDALNHLNSATEPESPFQMVSDVQTVDSFRCVRMSLYEAIQTVQERWGGHLVRDGFKIGIMSSIGQDRGVTVEYKKNLRDITCEENWDSVVTKLLPVGKDGILLNAVNPSASIYIESDIQYDLPYCRTVTFSQDIEKENYRTDRAYKQALVADLRRQAVKYLSENCIPKVNYSLKANLDMITDIGDVIEVKDSRLGIDLMTNVIAYDYDCILGKYTEIEFGNFRQSLSGLVGNMMSDVDKTVNDQVTATKDDIMGILGDSYVIYDGNRILIVDTLPKESATNVIVLDRYGIGFSQTGISGQFTYALTIDGVFNMDDVEVTNFDLSMISGGLLTLGGNLNEHGQIEVYDANGNIIATIGNDGITAFFNGQRVFWTDDGDLCANSLIVNGNDLNYATAECTIASGWQDYSSGVNPVVRRQGKAVSISWTCKPTQSVMLNETRQTVCTIPEGFRPSSPVYMLMQGSSTRIFDVVIQTSGLVQIGRLRNMNSTSYENATSSMWFPISASWII